MGNRQIGLVLVALLGVQLVLFATALSKSASRYPYTTTIATGDFNAARMLYGDQAQASVPGHDVIPMFTTVAAYQRYYASADDNSCDEACVKKTYNFLRTTSSVELVPIGTRVRVLSEFADEQDHGYTICRVQIPGHAHPLLVLSVALAN